MANGVSRHRGPSSSHPSCVQSDVQGRPAAASHDAPWSHTPPCGKLRRMNWFQASSSSFSIRLDLLAGGAGRMAFTRVGPVVARRLVCIGLWRGCMQQRRGVSERASDDVASDRFVGRRSLPVGPRTPGRLLDPACAIADRSAWSRAGHRVRAQPAANLADAYRKRRQVDHGGQRDPPPGNRPRPPGQMVPRGRLELPTYGFRFVWLSPLPGLCLRRALAGLGDSRRVSTHARPFRDCLARRSLAATRGRAFAEFGCLHPQGFPRGALFHQGNRCSVQLSYRGPILSALTYTGEPSAMPSQNGTRPTAATQRPSGRPPASRPAPGEQTAATRLRTRDSRLVVIRGNVQAAREAHLHPDARVAAPSPRPPRLTGPMFRPIFRPRLLHVSRRPPISR